ncbi:MAG: DUF1287 domain-containing protein [Pseudomonadota bacterium]
MATAFVLAGMFQLERGFAIMRLGVEPVAARETPPQVLLTSVSDMPFQLGPSLMGPVGRRLRLPVLPDISAVRPADRLAADVPNTQPLNHAVRFVAPLSGEASLDRDMRLLVAVADAEVPLGRPLVPLEPRARGPTDAALKAVDVSSGYETALLVSHDVRSGVRPHHHARSCFAGESESVDLARSPQSTWALSNGGGRGVVGHDGLLEAEAEADSDAFGIALVRAAKRQMRRMTVYTDAYFQIPFPNGDIPALYGVCSDVVVRAYRHLGIDLQERVSAAGLSRGLRSIAHRRTSVLRRLFNREGASLPVTEFGENFRPGDIVTYDRPQNAGSRFHIAIVSDEIGPSGDPMIVHNRGWGVQEEDALFVDTITGHYRYRGPGPSSAPRVLVSERDGFSPSLGVQRSRVGGEFGSADGRRATVPLPARRAASLAGKPLGS